jgi:hypothetical protein
VDKDVANRPAIGQALDFYQEKFKIKKVAGFCLTTGNPTGLAFCTYFVDKIVRKAHRERRPP